MNANQETKCSGIFRLLFGHHFEAVTFTEESMPVDVVGMADRVDDVFLEDAILAAKCRKESYVKHVCRRCGQIR